MYWWIVLVMGLLGNFVAFTLTITYWKYVVKLLDNLNKSSKWDGDDNRGVFWLGIVIGPWILALLWMLELTVLASFSAWYFWLNKHPKAEKIGEILFEDKK